MWRGTSVVADGGARGAGKRERDRRSPLETRRRRNKEDEARVRVRFSVSPFVPFVRLPSNKPLLGKKK